MLKKLLAVSAGLALALTVYAATTELRSDAPESYVVKKGDTLWSIAGRFLNKPWHWPEVWQDNPAVKNPHLIYPGDTLMLRDGHVGVGEFGPRIRADEGEAAIAAIPLSALKQWLKNTRIVSEESLRDAPHVVGIEENHLRGAPGQLIYVRGLSAQAGTRLALVRPIGRYYDSPPVDEGKPREVHRQSKDSFHDSRKQILWQHGPIEFTLKGNTRFLGYEVMDYGVVEVTRSGQDVSSALLVSSDFEAKDGDYVLPIVDAPYDAQYMPHRPDSVPDRMRVIALSDAFNAAGPMQVVALSRGSEDGIENGQTFSIYQKGAKVDDTTDYPKGTFRKFFHPKDSRAKLPPEFVGNVMVFRTFQRVSYGLVMDAIKPVHIGNFLHDPDSVP
ncbi:LysM domain-containing protein [Dokdonella sp.]|uniref:LysM peptidoglycan-binding domain-containing protein n=1 Tax=Dokdonella sp. TaxID=2291710 RepID=UPI0025BE53D4|nr:LysM domain-containing protein [Dokdonella sp.]MBX3690410.1 LysM peptidoglycan-binding domain-containing protein [Dokdonella sp.]